MPRDTFSLGFNLGHRFPNGATVIHQVTRDSDGARFVLCYWRGEYVTWRLDNEGNPEHGNYYPTLTSACLNLGKRVGKEV
jgi:hypothetical protein